MKIILLAGGKGERLLPLTNTLPKPMVKVGGKPLIEYTVNLFKKNGYKDFVFTLCYLPQKIKEYFGDGKKFGINTSYIIESENSPLGTAGALSELRGKIKDTFVVCAGDILRESNINSLIEFHKKKKAITTIGVYDNKKPNPKSIVTFNRMGRIIDFLERPRKLPLGKIWSNASLYILEPEVFDYIPNGIPSDFGKDVFPKIVSDKKKIYANIQTGYFLDVGTIEKLKRAEDDLRNGAYNE